MNQRGGMIELFFGMLLAIFLVSVFVYRLYPSVYPLIASSTWSGAGTTAGILFGAIGMILITLVLFWSYKSNVSGANF